MTLLFDNLVQFDTEAQLQPGLATRWESDPTGAVLHLPPPDRRHVSRRPADRRPRRACLDPPGAGPGLQGRRGSGRCFPIKGAREYAAGKARAVAGIAVPDDTTIVFTLTEPLNIFPKFLAMPVAAVVPTPTPPGFDQAPVGSGPWRFVSWSHDDAIVLARNTTYWAGPAEGGHPHHPHHPGGAHPGRRVRDRQPERGRDPLRGDPALGDGASRGAAAPARRSGTSTSR